MGESSCDGTAHGVAAKSKNIAPTGKLGLPPARERRRAPGVRDAGFTLIEILVALIIFAIMALLSYRAIAAVLDSRDQLTSETQKWRDCALFFARVEQDLGAVLDRPVRSADDLAAPAFIINPDPGAEAVFALTRAGFAQSDGVLAAPQRVGYRARDGRVDLVLWPHPDAAPRSSAQAYAALGGVADLKLRALDARGNWQPRWPLAAAGAAAETFPAAVELTLTLRSGESVTRLFAMRGGG